MLARVGVRLPIKAHRAYEGADTGGAQSMLEV
jgi:hypothetical protein